MIRNPLFFVAVYLRLSRDDEDMELFDIYMDDGYSGANFDRPEFKRMMDDIEAENINCVIVKDLSRLGRDYIEAGRLIQKTFPAFHVRFIVLTDNFDSQTADNNTKSLVIVCSHFFSVLLFCGDCKEPMYRRVNCYKGVSKVFYLFHKEQRAGLHEETYFKNFRTIYEKKYEEAKGALQRQEEFNKMLILQEYMASRTESREGAYT